MILIGLGANLDHPEFGSPIHTLLAAVTEIGKNYPVIRHSSWYSSAPVPSSDQPWFVNAVISISSDSKLGTTLETLQNIEKKFGRIRREKWEARVLDLDLLAFNGEITDNQNQSDGPVVPHPLMQYRAFVLAPIAEIAPEWRHPVSGISALELLKILPESQEFKILRAGDSSD